MKWFQAFLISRPDSLISLAVPVDIWSRNLANENMGVSEAARHGEENAENDYFFLNPYSLGVKIACFSI